MLYLVADPIAALRLEALNPSARSLDSMYEAGKDRHRTYEEMADAFLAPARSGLRSCAVLYGHPGVFGLPAHAALAQARAEGISARMLPAVSALDCLFADLGVDPGDSGMLCYEATYFLERTPPVDLDATLVLLQVGMIGERGGDPTPDAAGRFRELVDRLETLYGAATEAVLYTASPYPGAMPGIVRFPLGEPDPPAPDLAATLCIAGR